MSTDIQFSRLADIGAPHWLPLILPIRLTMMRDRLDTWHYLLVSEDHVKTAKGSWTALRQLGE